MKKILFQCNEGRAVRNQPALFMADYDDALRWGQDGVGFIVPDEVDPEPEPEEIIEEIEIIELIPPEPEPEPKIEIKEELKKPENKGVKKNAKK